VQEQILKILKSQFGEEDRRTLIGANNLADTMREQGDRHVAEKLSKTILDARTKLLGEDDPDTLVSMNNYAGKVKSGPLRRGARALSKGV